MKYRLGLIAKDMHNSVTPRVYGAFAKDLGVDISFEILNVMPQHLDETIEYAKTNLDGFNVTMPYKQKILSYANVLHESASQCGSTNVMLVREGRLIAYNTDGWGLVKALSLKGFDTGGKSVVMVGAGGVGLSIAYNLGINHVERVDVINIFADEAQRLCERFGPAFHPHLLTDENLSNWLQKRGSVYQRLCSGSGRLR